MAQGHRDRIYNKFLNDDEIISELDVLELLLCYCIPRKDVRPIAVSLLEKFGSLNAVINADPKKLLKVKGVGKKVAAFFKVLHMLDKRVVVQSKPKINSVHDTVNYFLTYFEGKKLEQFVIALLSDDGSLMDTLLFNSDSDDSVSIDMKHLSVEVAKAEPKSVVIAHNHPSGKVTPSVADDVATKKILTILNAQSVNLLDHIIVADNDYFSYHSSNRLAAIREELLR